MRRLTVLLAAIATLAVAAGVAGTTLGAAQPAGARAGSPTKLTIWVGWTQRELSVFKKVVAEYDQSHPDVTVDVLGGVNDNKIVAAIRAGDAPDVVSSFNSYNVGSYCSTGAWVDLTPFLKQDHIAVGSFPAAPRYYTSYAGKQCALPLLADSYGLYYNKTLFAKAGIKQPPRTMSQLAADAEKLTQRSPSGKIQVAGLDPVIGFYENVPERWITSFGGSWLDSSNHSILAKDPAWTKMLKWQKSLIDWYGYNNLVRFQAGLGDEFSSSNAFETGKVAMALDGEWRVAFIAAEHPGLKYGTAPMPVDDSKPQLYGSGYINGTIIGIPKGGHDQTQAWALVRWLTTNTHALAELSNGLRNVPTTRASLTSKELTPDAQFATFLRIFANPHSTTSPITAAGVAYTNQVQSFAEKWQAGQVSNLSSGLSSLDKQLDAMVAQAGGGGSGPP
jgi:multiple sugar transport system substrate-binding protein